MNWTKIKDEILDRFPNRDERVTDETEILKFIRDLDDYQISCLITLCSMSYCEGKLEVYGNSLN